MDISVITQIAQLGATGILLVILYFLWGEFKEQKNSSATSFSSPKPSARLLPTCLA